MIKHKELFNCENPYRMDSRNRAQIAIMAGVHSRQINWCSDLFGFAACSGAPPSPLAGSNANGCQDYSSYIRTAGVILYLRIAVRNKSPHHEVVPSGR